MKRRLAVLGRADNAYTAVTEWTAEGWSRGQVWRTARPETQPAFGTTPGGRHTLDLANGVLNEPEANVIPLRVWVRGALLP